MRLITTSTIFPGGWRYNQLDLNGRLLKAFRSMGPYGDFVGTILNFRKANRLARCSWDEVDADVQDHLCRQCGQDPRYCITDVKKNPWQPRAVVGRAATAVKLLARGSAILSDWLGAGGKPVSPELAQNRADVCTGRLSGTPCPHNRQDVDFSFVTAPIAKFIREQMQKRMELKLNVLGESQLHTCAICLCALKLKVHTPFPVIQERTPDSMFAKFREDAPVYCWINKENTPA